MTNYRKDDVRGRNQKLAGVFYNQRRGCYDQGNILLSNENVQTTFKTSSSAPNFADMSCVEQMQLSPEATANQDGYKDKSGSLNFLVSPVDTRNDILEATTDQCKRKADQQTGASLSVVNEDKRDDSK